MIYISIYMHVCLWWHFCIYACVCMIYTLFLFTFDSSRSSCPSRLLVPSSFPRILSCFYNRTNTTCVSCDPLLSLSFHTLPSSSQCLFCSCSMVLCCCGLVSWNRVSLCSLSCPTACCAAYGSLTLPTLPYQPSKCWNYSLHDNTPAQGLNSEMALKSITLLNCDKWGWLCVFSV